MLKDLNKINIDMFEKGKEQVVKGAVQDVEYILHPETMRVTDFEKLADSRLEKPKRIQESVSVQTFKSFVDYVSRFKNEDSTIFIDRDAHQLNCKIDYHTRNDGARWCDHEVTYSFKRTKEWCAWKDYNNKKMLQEDFAMFIEDNLSEIQDPEPAVMLEIATSLKAKVDVDFTSNIRIDNGQVQLAYKEKIDGNAGVNGQIEIPQMLKLAVKPFEGGKPYELDARFRYRINSGKLAMWYTLIRPQLRVDHAIDEIVEAIKTELPELQAIEGKTI